jgi:hemolysin activation/secretion protein
MTDRLLWRASAVARGATCGIAATLAAIVAPAVATAQGGPLAGPPSAAAIEAAREAERAAEQAVAQPQASGRPPAPTAPRSFVLREIRFSPSAYLEADTLAAVQAAFAGQRLRADRLGGLTDAIARLYADRNIVLAQAFVRGVDTRAGIVEIELFEARIGAVEVESQTASAEYYRWRLGLAPGDLADTRLIDARLARIALTDNVAFDARFTPGAALGQTNLAVKVTEGARLSGEITVDNYGTDTRGPMRIGVTFRNASLTGWNDPLVLSLSGGEHAQSLTVAYARPVHPSGMTLAVSLGADMSQSVATPRVQTRTRFGELALSAPVIVEEARRLSLTASAQAFAERSTLAGVTTVDQRGAAITLGATAAWFGPRTTFALSQSVRFARHDDIVANQRNLSSVSLPGEASIATRLSEATVFSLRAGWQIAARGAAPARLKFSTASPFAVRGYPTGLQSGDGGWYLRAQLETRVPATRLPRRMALTPFVFADTGEAHDLVGGARVGLGRLASVGAGASITWDDRLYADVFVAKPLRDVPGFSAGGKWSVFARVGTRF